MIELSTRQEDDLMVISVGGEVDASSSIELDQVIADAIEVHKKIVIDCHELQYISSAGLGVFMSYIQEIEANSIKMVLCGLQDKVFNVFQILGLDQLLSITDSFEEAKELANEV